MTTRQSIEELNASPLAPAPSTRPLWRSKSEHPGKILVADDESLSAASLILSLRALGYTVIGPAHDGEHAIELAFSTLPDMALLDARMSTDTDGLDAAKAMFNDLMLPVVIVSAFSDREQVNVAAQAGVFGYLVKPVSKEQLRPAIEVAWARFNQYMSKEIEAEVLYRHLEDRRDIDRARWVLVERGIADESEAMRELRRRSRVSGRSLGEVAREVLQD
ncbi:MAG: response regulator [Planctomycetes bacterium]|nr:response regulator [Planctomycetota bacterium]